jgi:hypothetical protein
MNPHFRKGNKAKHGSGHLWVLADIDDMSDMDMDLTKDLTKISSSEATGGGGGEDEDEAAKAVRSILGHNIELDLEQKRLQQRSDSFDTINEDKENSAVKRSARIKEKVVNTGGGSDLSLRGLKRPAVEVQYVATESKLDAPGNYYLDFRVNKSISLPHPRCPLDVFVTTDIHNTACIPPPTTSKRPNLHHAASQPQIQPMDPSHHPGSVPFNPMDQIEEIDVAAYCGGYQPSSTTSTAAASAASATVTAATTASGTTAQDDVDCLEKALGIDFHDPNVVQNHHRQLLAK